MKLSSLVTFEVPKAMKIPIEVFWLAKVTKHSEKIPDSFFTHFILKMEAV
jgi:hypothetical protein